MTRFIGIRHRRKQTREGEARPTMIAILEGQDTKVYGLGDDTAELDFVMGRFPVAWRDAGVSEPITWFDPKTAPNGLRQWHCKWRKAKTDEDVSTVETTHVREVLSPKGLPTTEVLVKVPTSFCGLRPGDKVGMMLGGSGDRYAAALSNRGEKIGAETYRIPPFVFADYRAQADKDDDHLTLASCVQRRRDLFYRMRPSDRGSIRIMEALALRQDAMRDRIRCEQRILQSLVGRVFLSEEGHYPEGVIKDQFDREKADDKIFQGLVSEEERRDKELARAVKGTLVWQAIFEPIQGCGPRVAAGLIAPISDIRRFLVEADPRRMGELRRQCLELERQGRLGEDLDKVSARCTSATTHFQKVQMVRSWKRQYGSEEEAKLLDEAIKLHQRRAQLRRQASRSRGRAKLRKFCGVHVITPFYCEACDKTFKPEELVQREIAGDMLLVCPACITDKLERMPGIFPRRRTGQVANWNPTARQALYLLGDQFNRRPDSTWGKVLLHYKEVLRKAHPEVVEEEVRARKGNRTVTEMRKRYTNGHIHKMALWRTLSKFVDHLFDTWSALERDQQQNEGA